ncbi:DUF3299 domain-containing protein [Ferrimonas balearica]|uniref:DUF3299 domain-containing protein n=1 Tax=Ferrimonas balearica TaxID=44012 RepID=UPI001C998FBC|nr:DUF3299 domain-containing protein [Ferrimonas balearica]MBY5991367.1 DUF3299 domain-containing protein [Ferrimonas balearica]
MIKRFIRTWLAVVLACASAFSFAGEVQSLKWVDLIPEDEIERHELMMAAQNASMALLDHSSNTPKMNQMTFGSTRQELDGQTVAISGFIIPLEGDHETLTEFLLVPFVGACIHVPPPPPNQMIYVTAENGVAMQELWAGVTIQGVMSTESVGNELAEIGYQMSLESIKKY